MIATTPKLTQTAATPVNPPGADRLKVSPTTTRLAGRLRFAKWVFRAAAVWSFPLTVPMYFTEAQFGIDNPPAVTHPEFYYGFLSLVLAWAVAFFVVSTDPRRYRPLMLVGVLEKLSYAIAIPTLVSQGRTPSVLLAFAAADLIFGVLFATAYRVTGPRSLTDELSVERRPNDR